MQAGPLDETGTGRQTLTRERITVSAKGNKGSKRREDHYETKETSYSRCSAPHGIPRAGPGGIPRNRGERVVSHMKTMSLRPHHLLCLRIRPAEFPDRQGEFPDMERMVKAAIHPESGFMLRVARGIDELCRVCPNCGGDRCVDSPLNEEAVRELDAAILNDLGVQYGHEMISKDWDDLINRKAPLNFCLTRCPQRAGCPASSAKKE